MKKILLYIFALSICNFLCVKYAFAHDNSRLIGLFVFLLGGYLIFQIPINVARLILKGNFSYDDLKSPNASKDKTLNKAGFITVSFLVLIIGLHILYYISFFKLQNELLQKEGIFIKTVVNEKKWEKRGKKTKAAYYIYYNYIFNGKVYHHNNVLESAEIGDTIIVKLLPGNPDNHIIIKQ